MGTGNSRPRQVVFTGITSDIGSFYFYLLEMELKTTDESQCTILLYNNDFSRLDDEKFKDILYLTATKNRWPSPHYTWGTFKQSMIADEPFSQVTMRRINHPQVSRTSADPTQTGLRVDIDPQTWSQTLLQRMEDLDLPGSVLPS